MRTAAKIVAGIVALVVVVSAVLAGAYLTGVIQKPTGSVEDIGDWGTVTEERTEIETDIRVRNPNPFGLSIGSGIEASYSLYLNGVEMATGHKQGVSIQPGNNTVTLTTYVQNEDLVPWWVAYVRNGETITMHVEGSVRVGAGPLSTSFAIPSFQQTLQEDSKPVIGAFSGAAASLEGNYTRTVSVSKGPATREVTVGYQVRRGWATWGEVTNETTKVRLHYTLHNPSEYVPVPAVPDGLAATVEANGVELISAKGDEFAVRNVGRNETIEPGETREVVFVVTMDNDKVDDWFRSHVRNGEETRVETQFQLVFDVQGQTIRAPQDGGATYTCTFRTGILVDNQTTSTTCGSAESATPA